MIGYGRFRARPTRVFARRVYIRSVVVTPSGVIIARPGEWIVLDGEGNTAVLSNAEFERIYEEDVIPEPKTYVRRRRS